MSWINWVYHSKNHKQCYYHANCVVSFIRRFSFFLTFMNRRKRRVLVSKPEALMISETVDD